MKIDFTSTDPQHIADLGDIQRHFQVDDPGYKFITQRPVIYNRFASGHLTDEAHRQRLVWLEKHQQGLIDSILHPDFIEKVTRERTDGHYSITLIKELFSGGENEGRFISIAISLSRDFEAGYHQITTIHPTRWRNIFYKDGRIKEKYLKVK